MRLFFWKKAEDKVRRERRRHPRIRVFLKIDYQITDEIPRLNCEARDISEGGIRFGLFQQIASGTPLKLKIYLDNAAEPVDILGKVTWAKETPGKDFPYEVGIVFEPHLSSPIDKIKKFIQNISVERQE
jgi:hypothetical protein